MLITDIMIGDIVLKNGEYHKVELIDFADEADCIYEGISGLEPAELTEEMMIKFGFGKIEYSGTFFMDKIPFEIRINNKHHMNKFWVDDQEGNITYHCSFIHTLQHLLRTFDVYLTLQP